MAHGVHCFTQFHSAKTYKIFDFEKKHKQFAISLYRYTEIPFCFRLKHGVIALFTIASIAAAEKRPLSYQTPQYVHNARNRDV